MQAYCVKCKDMRDIQDAEAIVMKNGRPATRGTCGFCGTKMFRIGETEAHKNMG
ncbi:MAG: DUF5679 domain-containing protein [Anaerolineaceae bacterium]|nr:DUF5679 domain-containing protein [Anaerolineaceae bacterium]MCY3936116.1 DUF5679 domain-containing protein [Chloroflexota bacterium]MCY4010163.1 DUF5679 domain-containing protein [Anaerolineaceae bacterium]MCY4105466.1 DUF5679 domain-containing protein [Chloroflexota bacterium]